MCRTVWDTCSSFPEFPHSVLGKMWPPKEQGEFQEAGESEQSCTMETDYRTLHHHCIFFFPPPLFSGLRWKPWKWQELLSETVDIKGGVCLQLLLKQTKHAGSHFYLKFVWRTASVLRDKYYYLQISAVHRPGRLWGVRQTAWKDIEGISLSRETHHGKGIRRD